MNASRLKKMTAAVAGLGLGLGLTACAGSFVAETDAQSPLAPRVQQIVDTHRVYPRWADFPATPSDLPRPVELATRVDALNASSAVLDGEAARLEWTLSDPAAFVAQVNRRIQAAPVSPMSAQTQEEIEALAERLRQRATAPPPVPRRQ
ncbi:hypothetical protein [Brevundimonas sp.]|uniref:hypothetical protein n=1 Tax=Brevundimonas sp. TaxID=1871086 RepID=UPI002FDA37FE